MEKAVYVAGWGAMLVLALILLGAWVYPQEVMVGMPRPALLGLGVIWLGAVIGGLISAWTFRK